VTSEERISVLVADDDVDFRMLVRRALTRSGAYEVVAEAADAPEVLALAQELQPQIALIDLRLPGMSDQQLLGQLVAEAPRCMVAGLSGRDPELEEDRVRSVGAFAFYEKTHVGGDLLRLLSEDWSLFERALDGEDVVAPSALSRR
jgi:two-component system, NarL family, nitrate/nitrite response regulator NarL